MEEKTDGYDRADALSVCIESLPTWKRLGADTQTDIHNLVIKLRALSPHGKGVVEQDHGSARDLAQATGGSCEDGLKAALEPFAALARIRYPEEGGAPSWIDIMTANGEQDEIELRSHTAAHPRSQILFGDDFRRALAALSSHDEQAAKGVVPGGQKDLPHGRGGDVAGVVERIILRRLHENKIDGYTLPMSEEIAAVLSRPTEGGEAVAWRWRHEIDGPITGWSYAETVFPNPSAAHRWEIQPLFAASPATPSGEIAGLPYGFLSWLEGEANEASEYAGAFIQEGAGGIPEHVRAHETMLHEALRALSQSPAAGEGNK